MSQALGQAGGEVPDGVRSEIDAADAAFMEAFNRGDAGSAARAVHSSDAYIMPPGAPPVEGRENIAAFWKGAQQQLGITRADLKTLKLRPAGEYVHQVGSVLLTFANGQQAHGKYAVLWKREDGDLKWHVDTWNLDV